MGHQSANILVVRLQLSGCLQVGYNKAVTYMYKRGEVVLVITAKTEVQLIAITIKDAGIWLGTIV